MLSEWCRKKYEQACDRGDMVSAGHYSELYLMWQGRGM